MDDLKQALTEATSILLVLPEHALDRDYLAALQLRTVAPEKTYLIAPDEKESLWQKVFSSNPHPHKKEFSISINTALSPVEELRYEKIGDELVIYLSHKQKFNRKAISFSEHIPPGDLFITVGFPSQSEAERAIEPLPHKGAARHIWFEGENGTRSHEKLSPSSAGLLGRLMMRSREDEDLGMLWSFVTREDFTKTNTVPDDIPHLIKSFSEIATLPATLAIFWQYDEGNGTKGILWSLDEALLAEVASGLSMPRDAGHPLTLPVFSNFIEAETTLRKLLPLGA